jgi:hypothetical protein
MRFANEGGDVDAQAAVAKKYPPHSGGCLAAARLQG